MKDIHHYRLRDVNQLDYLLSDIKWNSIQLEAGTIDGELDVFHDQNMDMYIRRAYWCSPSFIRCVRIYPMMCHVILPLSLEAGDDCSLFMMPLTTMPDGCIFQLQNRRAINILNISGPASLLPKANYDDMLVNASKGLGFRLRHASVCALKELVHLYLLKRMPYDPEQMLMLLGSILSQSDAERVDIPYHYRNTIYNETVAFLDEKSIECPRVDDLCSALNFKRRSLEYAFHEHFHISPARFMKVYRLNRVRKILLQIEELTNIASVANEWGFWHMGKFSADYKQLFGELPSQTPKLLSPLAQK